MARVTEEQIAAWKDQYGDVRKIPVELPDAGLEEEWYFQRPKATHISRCSEELGKSQFKALRNLILGCLIYPDKEKVSAVLEEWPGLVFSVGNELLSVAGLAQNFFSVKL